MEEKKRLIWPEKREVTRPKGDKTDSSQQKEKVIIKLSDCEDITEEELFAALA